MKSKLFFILLAVLASGCVSRTRMKMYGDMRYAKGVADGALVAAKSDQRVIEAEHRAESAEWNVKQAIFERNFLAAKIRRYLAQNCLCKHKDVLK